MSIRWPVLLDVRRIARALWWRSTCVVWVVGMTSVNILIVDLCLALNCCYAGRKLILPVVPWLMRECRDYYNTLFKPNSQTKLSKNCDSVQRMPCCLLSFAWSIVGWLPTPTWTSPVCFCLYCVLPSRLWRKFLVTFNAQVPWSFLPRLSTSLWPWIYVPKPSSCCSIVVVHRNMADKRQNKAENYFLNYFVILGISSDASMVLLEHARCPIVRYFFICRQIRKKKTNQLHTWWSDSTF